MSSFIEDLESPHLGHMTVSEIQFESPDEIL